MIKDEPDRSKARRDALRIIAGGLLLGGWPAANPAHAQTGKRAGCVLTPAQTEGPYFVDERLDRSDVREDPATGAARPGAVLTLDLGVAAVDGARCVPLRGATQTIGADAVSAEDAALLGVPVGSPVLRCERLTTDVDGRPVLLSEHVFPAHRTEFVVELPHAEPLIAPTGLRLVD